MGVSTPIHKIMSKQIHSPFHIVENFISPAICDQIISELGLAAPTYEVDEITPIKNERFLSGTRFDKVLQDRLSEHADAIERRYRGTISGIDQPRFVQHFEDPKNPAVPHGCESAKFLRKKWVKVKDVDIVGYVWLKDYNAGVPLDPSFEVYGGKLEFPAFNFSLLPKRGTCMIFPAGPHFISAISHVLVGSTEYIKFSLKLAVETETGEAMWFYQPQNFPGSYQQWFN